jgi:hypothetical protein
LWAIEGIIVETTPLELNAAIRTLDSSTNSVAFGDVPLNTAATQTVTLNSAGSEPVTIHSATLAGTGYTLNGPALPMVLNPGQEMVLTLQFDPGVVGASTGMLTIASDDSSGTATVINLSGSGTDGSSGGSGGGSGGSGGGSGGSGGSGGTPPPPALSALACSAASITGAGTESCSVTLTAAAPTGGFAVNLASNNPAVTVPGSVVIPAGAASGVFSATIVAVPAAETATLAAAANGVSQSFTLQLNAATAVLSANTSSVRFGSVALNAAVTQTLTLTSTGSAGVSISAVSVNGAGFTVSGTALPVTLNPGQSVTLEVGFLPTVAGTVTGQLTIVSNAISGGTMVIALSGTGAQTHSVGLTWLAPVSSADPVVGYNVYRSPSGAGAFQLLNAGVDLTTGYIDSSVQNGLAYDYVVTSVDSAGAESVPSNLFTATIPQQ